MSKQVDLDKPLSKEDRAYLESRGRRYLIIQNDRQFGPEGDGAPSPAPQGTDADEDEDEWEAQVNELTVPELKDELGGRGLDTSGNKDALRARLIEAG